MENTSSFPVVLRYLVFVIGAPRLLPLGDNEALSPPFPTNRRAKADPVDVLYASVIQGSYLCKQTAASRPILSTTLSLGIVTFAYTGK